MNGVESVERKLELSWIGALLLPSQVLDSRTIMQDEER